MTAPDSDQPAIVKRRPADVPEHGVTPEFGGGALGDDGEERIRSSRAVVWLLVFAAVVAGVVLYLLFATRLSPLLG